MNMMRKALWIVLACCFAFSCSLANLISGTGRLVEMDDSNASEFRSIVEKSNDIPVMVLMYRDSDSNKDEISGCVDEVARDKEYSSVKFYKVRISSSSSEMVASKAERDSIGRYVSDLAGLGSDFSTPVLVTFKGGEKVGQPRTGAAITKDAVKSIANEYKPAASCDGDGCADDAPNGDGEGCDGGDCTDDAPNGDGEGCDGDSCTDNPSSGDQAPSGQDGGDFEVSGNGKYVEITSDAAYKALVADNTSDVIVVDFWKGQCALCFYMESKMKALAQAYKSVKFYNVQAYGTNWPTEVPDNMDWNYFRTSEYHQQFLDDGYSDTGNNLETYRQIVEWEWMQHGGNRDELLAFFNKGKNNLRVASSYAYDAENELCSTNPSDYIGPSGYTPRVMIFKNGVIKKIISGSQDGDKKGWATEQSVLESAIESVL